MRLAAAIHWYARGEMSQETVVVPTAVTGEMHRRGLTDITVQALQITAWIGSVSV
jgi:hypothetical protein